MQIKILLKRIGFPIKLHEWTETSRPILKTLGILNGIGSIASFLKWNLNADITIGINGFKSKKGLIAP